MSTGVPPVVITQAPVRVCDVGGWTDTWFARNGAVCSIAINRYVTVTIHSTRQLVPQVTFDVRNYATILSLAEARTYHPLLAVALDEIPIPEHCSLHIIIDADMPPGSSTGTSAAVSVALLAALTTITNKSLSPDELAKRAHRLETHHLAQQSGVQDQIGAAFGGANFIEITEYPETRVTPLSIPANTIAAFNAQHMLFYYGKPHHSSAIHSQVIEHLPNNQSSLSALDQMRQAARIAATSLSNGDLRRFAEQLKENTEAQAILHPDLINKTARGIISIAQSFDAWGWKVNGAGGDGGSISIIASEFGEQSLTMRNEILHQYPDVQYISSAFCPYGVRILVQE